MKRLLVLVSLVFSVSLSGAERYIVEFRPGARRMASLAVDAPGLRVTREYRRALYGAAVELPEGQSVETLTRLPYVARVHPDAVVKALGSYQSYRSHRSYQSHGTGGAGIVVAVADTGIDYTHPALAGKVLGGWDFANDDDDPMDDHRHGTHVAGIIAAESAQMTGVAPGVSLLAYKVLDRDGNGPASQVIAGIERAMDPNGDGDLSDRADVLNLSLGYAGHPDDPISRAVENAVAAGIVVCVAAGNDGTFHSIASPAVAPSAITVGASAFEEGERVIAYFSSRGPAAQSGAIKPDILAPGKDILSTGLHHEMIVLSGTSMAAPYVAGLAALLLEQHPDWTPARVKAALAATAVPVAGEEVMAQGSGWADLARAAANDLVVAPTQLNFGLDGLTGASYRAMRTLRLRNESAGPRTVRLRADTESEAFALTMPAEITLAAGETRDVEIAIDVDHAKLAAPPTRSLSFGGTLLLEWDGDSVRVPWAFIRSGRATITYDGIVPDVYWSSENANRRYSSVRLIGHGVEALLQPGVYDFVAVAAKEGDVRLVVAEEQRVEGDLVLALSPASAPHAVRFEGVDERGQAFADGNGTTTLRSRIARLLLPNGSVPLQEPRTLHASAFSDRYGLLLTEAFVDAGGRRMVVAQYPEQRGMSSDVALRVTAADYAAQELRVHFTPGAAKRELTIMPRDWPRNANEFFPVAPAVLRVDAVSDVWSGTLHMTPEVHTDFTSGVQLSASTDRDPMYVPAIITPMIRRTAEGFRAIRGFGSTALPAGAVAGEAFEFGLAPIVPDVRFAPTDHALLGDPEFLGSRNELLRTKKLGMTYRVTNAANVETATGTLGLGTFVAPLSGNGPFRAELRLGDSTLTTRFDRSSTVPSLSSLAILDGTGRHATRLPYNGNGSLYFSARGATRAELFFRRRGAGTWVQLTAVEVATEEAPGTIYRADLRDALRVAGELELKIEIADAEGDSLSWHLVPALTVEVTGGPKRRAVR